MNKAQYLSTSPETGGNGRYPLSTQGLNFVQSQIELLQELSRIGGKRYILKQPVGNEVGYIVIDNELLPLSGSSSGKGIKVYEERQDIQADGETYTAARIIRYAQYQANYTANTPDLYDANGFKVLPTNPELDRRITELEGLRSLIAARLEIRTGIFTAVQINNLFDNVRLQCRRGSVSLNGADTYTLNVYRTGSTAANGTVESVTQEQILPDLRRFTRQYDPDNQTWSKWTFCTDNFHIDVKVVDGTTVWVRHGEVPVGVELVLLRKKKRSHWRRTGGNNATPDNRGIKARRQSKNQYVHYKGVILTLGTPNKWYVPKCKSVGKAEYNSLIGKELGSICGGLIGGTTKRKVRGTSIKFQKPEVLTGHAAAAYNGRMPWKTSAYAKIGLQFAAAGATYKGAGGEMVKMKYRVWFHKEENGTYKEWHAFSVD